MDDYPELYEFIQDVGEDLETPRHWAWAIQALSERDQDIVIRQMTNFFRELGTEMDNIFEDEDFTNSIGRFNRSGEWN